MDDSALHQQRAWLYLVDENTGRAAMQRGDATYPIEIKKPREYLRQYMPLMNMGIATMHAHNGMAGIARLFGISIPKVPAGLISMAESTRTPWARRWNLWLRNGRNEPRVYGLRAG